MSGKSEREPISLMLTSLFRWRYRNRFAFLGNGDIKATESKDVQGLSTYMRSNDHEWDVD